MRKMILDTSSAFAITGSGALVQGGRCGCSQTGGSNVWWKLWFDSHSNTPLEHTWDLQPPVYTVFRKSFHICILGYLGYFMLQRSVGIALENGHRWSRRFCVFFLNSAVFVSLVFQIPAKVWFLGLVCRALIPPHQVFRSLGFGL